MKKTLRNEQSGTNYPRAAYSRFFRAKYMRLLRAAFSRGERRVSYADPAVTEKIIALYQAFNREIKPAKQPPVPKHIWMLWQQGWDEAPALVRACAQSWKDKNKGWELHLVDENSIDDLAPAYGRFHAPKASRTALSNMARLSLLAEHGGVWADATLFCQQPLDDWLPKVMGEGFFAFSEPRPYRHCDIWFLASQPHSHLMEAWYAMARDYWGHFRRPHHYYWMEYLFEFLVANDPEAARIWENMPKLSALGPLIVQGVAFERPVPDFVVSEIEHGSVPVQKLSHKWRYSKPLQGTAVGLLTGLKSLR